MATVLDLVKHYQNVIEKNPNDGNIVLKSIDRLFQLNVTVQHLQDTGVGRTVNALRKEAGEVGQAARALVYKWKIMVAAEETDQEGDHDTKTHNGHENGKDSDDSARKYSTIKHEHHDETNSSVKTENKSINGHYSGSKRKHRSSEEETPDTKKIKGSSNNDSYYQRANMHVKRDASESESDDSDDSHSSESDSESSEYSEDEQETSRSTDKVKQKSLDQHKSKHLLPHKNHIDHKEESSSSKRANDSDKHSKSRHQSESIDKKSSDKSSSKEKVHRSENHKSSKDKDSSSSEKKSKSEHSSSKKDKKHKEESSSSQQKSSSDKHKSSKSDSSNEKHISNTEKHFSKSDKRRGSSHSHKSDNDKQKSSAEKDVSDEKHKSKDSRNHSSKEKHSSSGKDRSKDRSSSSKEKSDHSHKSEKKHSSSDSKLKQSDSKHKSERKEKGRGETKSKHKSSSLSSHTGKSSSSKSKEEVPKKKAQDSGADSDEGINCGSGASFAEALGMISPVKPKKKSKSSLKESVSPNTSANEDLSPASLLAPTAKLAPLPALEISALPEISPHYKPRPPPKLLPHFTEDEALNHSISSKNQRTKVYSGNKVIGKIPSLYEMCVTVLQEHIDALEYTGGVPYDILKPVVDRATPQQLFMLEHYNPYLMEDTDHLWQKFCEKHFRNKQRQELETWREMYMRCQEEQEHRLKSLTANIRIAQEVKKAPIKQTKMAYVDTVVKPPRNIARKQALHGTAHSASASPAARVASLSAAPNVLRGTARPSPSAPAPFNQKPKKAPLMQKALQFMRGRKR